MVVCGCTTPVLLASDEVLRLASWRDLVTPIEFELCVLEEFRTGLEVTSLVTTVLFWEAVILFESWVVFAEVCFVLYFPVLSMLWLLF